MFTEYVTYLLYAVVIVWVLYRQLVSRPVKENVTLYVIVIGIGLFETYNAVIANQLQLTGRTLGILAISLIVFTVGSGVLRASTCRVWIENGVKMRKGSALTFVLWIITIGGHIYLDTLIKGGGTTKLLSLGLSLFVQQIIVIQRANRLSTAGTGIRPFFTSEL